MKSILVILLMLFWGYVSNAQDPKSIKASELVNYIAQSNKVQIVHFWASWCAPCMEEMPYLQAIARRYAEKIELIMVSMDFKKSFPEKLKAFIIDRGIGGTHFWLNESDADYFCPLIDAGWSGSIPATLFINRKSGYRNFLEKQLSATELDNLVKDLLN